MSYRKYLTCLDDPIGTIGLPILGDFGGGWIMHKDCPSFAQTGSFNVLDPFAHHIAHVTALPFERVQ